MKIKFFILTGLLTSILMTSYGQISTRTVAEKAPDPVPAYDSLSKELFSPNDCKKFIGQKVYFKPQSKLTSNYASYGFHGYKHMTLKPSCMETEEIVFKPVVGFDNGFMKRYVTNYNDVVGQTFLIEDVIDQLDENKFLVQVNNGLFYKLRNVKTNEICYYDAKRASNGVMIIGFYEKLKKTYIGQKFILVREFIGVNDINTGKPVTPILGSTWTCMDISFIETKDDEYVVGVPVFRDSLNHEVAWMGPTANSFVSLKDLNKKREAEKQKEIERQKIEQANIEEAKREEAQRAKEDKIRKDNLIKKYGPRRGQMIYEGNVEVGMTADMCIEAWGEPEKVNRMTNSYGTREQWVYGNGNYLYIVNGKLETIQN